MTIIASLQANLDFNLNGANKVVEDLKKIKELGDKASSFGGPNALAVSGYVNKIEQLASNFTTMFSSAKLAGKSVEQQEAYLRNFGATIESVAGKMLALDQAKLKALSSPQQAGKLFASLFEGMDVNKLNSEIEKYKTAINELAKLGASTQSSKQLSTPVPPPPMVGLDANMSNIVRQSVVSNTEYLLKANLETLGASLRNAKISTGGTDLMAKTLNEGVGSIINNAVYGAAENLKSIKLVPVTFNTGELQASVSKGVDYLFNAQMQTFITSVKGAPIYKGNAELLSKEIGSAVSYTIGSVVTSTAASMKAAPVPKVTLNLDNVSRLVGQEFENMIAGQLAQISNATRASTTYKINIDDHIKNLNGSASNLIFKTIKATSDSVASTTPQAASLEGAQSAASNSVKQVLEKVVNSYLGAISAGVPKMDPSTYLAMVEKVSNNAKKLIWDSIGSAGASSGSKPAASGASGGDEAAWKRLNDTINATAAAQKKFTEGLDQILGKLGQASQATYNFVTANNAVNNASTAAAAATKAMGDAAKLAADKWAPFTSFAMLAGGRIGQIILWANQASLAFKDLGKALGATVIAGVGVSTLFGAGFKNMVRVAKELEPAENMLQAMGLNMDHLTEVSLKHGLEIGKVARSYISLKVAMDSNKPSFNGLEGTDIAKFSDFKKVFEDIASIGAKFGMKTEEMRGSFKAIEQMFSKGTVQAEEFRQQLGDRIPGAMAAGILAFREMTGKADASMRQFRDAMKDGAIISSEFVPLWTKNYKQMVGITEEGTNNINTAQQRLSTSFDLMIKRLDSTVGATKAYTFSLNALSVVFNSLKFNTVSGGLSLISTTLIAVAASGGLAAGAFKLASMAGITFGATLTGISTASMGLLRWLGPVGIALGAAALAMSMFSGTAKSATLDAEALIKKTDVALSETGTKLTATTLYKINTALAEIPPTIIALEKSRDEIRDSIVKLQEEAGKGVIKQIDENGIENEFKMTEELKKTLQDRILAYKNQETEISGAITRLNEQMKKGSEINSALVAGPPENTKTSATESTLSKLNKEIRVLELYVQDLKNLGSEAATAKKQIYETRQELDPNAKDLRAPSAKAGVEETVRRLSWRNALTEEVKGLEGLNAKRDEIIKHAENMMEGMGVKEANLIKKNDKLLADYVNALLATGEAYTVVEEKAARFRSALAMQEAGINLTTLQFKPFMAMQKGMESFADTLGDLVSKGELGTKTLGDAFKSMAQSIIKDLISMMIKVNIIKPLLSALFGVGGGDPISSLFSSATSSTSSSTDSLPIMEASALSMPYTPNQSYSTGLAAAQSISPTDPTIVINNYNPTSDSVALLKSQIPDMITQQIRDNRSRGKQ